MLDEVCQDGGGLVVLSEAVLEGENGERDSIHGRRIFSKNVERMQSKEIGL